jgi:hypothetical protein
MRNAAVLALIAAGAGVATMLVQGPLPGDVALTSALQAAAGSGGCWAGYLTATAKAPLLWAALTLAAALAWRASGWRGAVAVPLAYALAFVADKSLRAILFVPRPDPDVVTVAEPAASSGLPSTFGLVYGALFGVALLAHGHGRPAGVARVVAAVLLVAGISARIVMGGHWGSQMLASTSLGLLLASAALTILRHLPGSRG